MNPALPGMPEMRAVFEAAYRRRFGVPQGCTISFPDTPEAWEWWQAGFAAGRAEASKDAEPDLCPACGGSGESSYMSDGGPDAYEVPCDCPHCNGNQTLADAYDGVLKLLRREEKKYREVAAIMFHGRHGTVEGRLTDIAEYVMKPDMSAEWVRDRLLALADIAKTAAIPSAATPTKEQP